MKTHANSVVIVAHKYLTQPDDELVAHLAGRGLENVLHVTHSFSDAPDRTSGYRWFRNGRLYREARTRDYAFLPEPLIYLKELAFTLLLVLGTGVRFDQYIGMDGLCVLFGRLLRALGRAGSVVFWVIDFVPSGRFAEGWKNKVYAAINASSYRGADEVWDLSPRMFEAREQSLGLKQEDYRRLRLVPYGMWTDRIGRRPYEECEADTLVFMGHLIEKQGAQLVLRAMPEILARRPGFTFKIIGGGAYSDSLKALAGELGVADHCRFLGRIEDIRELEEEVARSCVAAAPYIRELDRWTRYADPGKVKTYLACGVPVALTDVPWNAREIEAERCGLIVSEDARDIADKILRLMEPALNREYRDNAARYARRFDYETIFADLYPEEAEKGEGRS